MALFKRNEKNWKDELGDEDKLILSEILYSTRKYRCAYQEADDVKVAQLWTALIEMKKELNRNQDMLVAALIPWKAIVAVGDEAKRKAIEKIVKELLKSSDYTTEKIVKEIIKTTDRTSDKTTDKLVESLMKF